MISSPASSALVAGIKKLEHNNHYHQHRKLSSEALGHDYEAVVTELTCKERGFTVYTCTRCGDTYTDAYTEALGHDWDEGTVTIEPTT